MPTRDRRTGFSRRRQYGAFLGYVLAVAGAVVGAVLLVISTSRPGTFAPARMTVATLTGPVSSGLDAVTRWIGAIPTAIGSWINVHGENATLRAEVTRSRTALMNARTIADDNRSLRRLLAVRDRSDDMVVAARLVSSTPSSGRRFALLNVGTVQGVHSGMPVRGPDGLVGRVTEVGPITARVLLLTDPESVVPVRRLGDGMPAIAAGRGDGRIDIRSAERTNVRFNMRDDFVTSGTGGLYPPGIPVARVGKAGIDQAIAIPFAAPDALDFAIVLNPFMPLPPPPPSLPSAP
jgi:rod shape-determining protein MreC